MANLAHQLLGLHISDPPSDRISSLPDKILVHILCFLPTTQNRIRTSVLSKRWRHLWVSVPSIDLPFELSSIEDYHSLVDRILDLYPLPTLTRLRLEDQPANPSSFDRSNEGLNALSCLPMDPFDRWIRFAASRSVSELDLTFHHPFPDTCDNPKVPRCLVELCFQFLASLKLTSLWFPSKFPHEFQGFASLKTLILKSVLFSNSDSLAKLFAEFCSSLEVLVIDKCHWVPNVTVTPALFPNLKKFVFVDRVQYSPQNMNSEAPNLRHLYFNGALECFHLRNCPQLRTAHIHASGNKLTSCLRLTEITDALASVETLVVGYWFFPHSWHWHWEWKNVFLCKDQPLCRGDTYPVPVFEKLREFHCHGILLSQPSLKALLFFICKSPLLEKLCINFDFYKPSLPELDDREEINKKNSRRGIESNDSSSEMDVLDGFQENPDLYEREAWRAQAVARVEEQKRLFFGPGVQLCLKTVMITQFSDDSIYMRMLRFILEKSPALELLQVNFVQQQHIELEQLQERISSFPRASPFVKIELFEAQVWDFEKCIGKCSPLHHLWSY